LREQGIVTSQVTEKSTIFLGQFTIFSGKIANKTALPSRTLALVALAPQPIVEEIHRRSELQTLEHKGSRDT